MVGGFKQPKHAYYVDYPTRLELRLLGEFQFIDEVLAYWGKHGDNYSIRFAEINQSYKRAIDFFKKRNDELNALTGFTLEQLFGIQQQLNNDFFHFGRDALHRHNWQKAENNFRHSFQRGTVTKKSKASPGIACSQLKIDMEMPARLIGKSTLDQIT